MSKSATEFLHHILDELIFLEEKSKQMSETEFMDDPVSQRAFARSLEIIGEAVKLMPVEVRTAHADVEWKGLAGLRDRLIHHYFGVDYALVWDVVTKELPGLKNKLSEIIKEF